MNLQLDVSINHCPIVAYCLQENYLHNTINETEEKEDPFQNVSSIRLNLIEAILSHYMMYSKSFRNSSFPPFSNSRVSREKTLQEDPLRSSGTSSNVCQPKNQWNHLAFSFCQLHEHVSTCNRAIGGVEYTHLRMECKSSKLTLPVIVQVSNLAEGSIVCH